MRLQDHINQSVNTNDLFSVKRCFNRLWVAFQHATSNDKRQLLNIAEYIRAKLNSEDYEWKTTIRHIDGLLELMHKAIK
jgi:hypothetical protein